jgi:hypothetical protein
VAALRLHLGGAGDTEMQHSTLSVQHHSNKREKKALLPHTHSHVSDTSDDGAEADYS